MSTALDLLEKAKCGTVVVDLPTPAAAQDLYDALTDADSVATILLDEKRIIINPS